MFPRKSRALPAKNAARLLLFPTPRTKVQMLQSQALSVVYHGIGLQVNTQQHNSGFSPKTVFSIGQGGAAHLPRLTGSSRPA